MIKTEVFLKQLINSVVHHLTQECENEGQHTYQQFMVRAELERRRRELHGDQPQMGISRAEVNLRVAAVMFFNGDVKAATDQWEAATIEDPDGYYEVEMKGLGHTIITAIDVTTNHRLPIPAE